MHWADNFAREVIKRDKEEFIVESGITPSGVVHIGNAREIFTQYFVYKSLKKLGKKAHFLYIWDDFDRFRKVPAGVDKKFEIYIGMSVSKVPDPWGCHESYANHFKERLAKELNTLNVDAEFISAAELYEKCTFAENIKTALEKKEVIKRILNKFRKKPLEEDWLPIRVYCEKCLKDTTQVSYLGGYKLKYICDCGYQNNISFSERGVVKLKWRIDWPSRWAYYGVDFESSGKDHKSYGGSWDTGVLISREVFNCEPPIGPMYEHIFLKGQKEKMSSSKGNVATLSNLLEIFEPAIVRFLYTQRINKAIFIPFDTDVYNIYNEFDRIEKVYYGVEKGTEEDRRKYELIRIEKYDKCPQRVSFSELTFLIQFLPKENFRENISEIFERRDIKLSEKDLELAEVRAERARSWVEKYAPDNVKIELSTEKIELSGTEREIIKEISSILKKRLSTEDLQHEFFRMSKKHGNMIFKTSYKVLIGKSHGPKLAYLIDAIGREKAIERFNEV